MVCWLPSEKRENCKQLANKNLIDKNTVCKVVFQIYAFLLPHPALSEGEGNRW
jgi:hypothetical protein